MIKALLTIDDMPSKNTPAIVDWLVSKNITAVMFAVGEQAEKFHDEAVYALKKGMIVGNHSYSHPYFSGLDMDACRKEIEKCEEVLEKLYADAEVERKYRFFRFPYGDKGGDKKDPLQKMLEEMKFDKVNDRDIPYAWWREQGHDRDIDTYWTYDFEEYTIRPGNGITFEDIINKMESKSPKNGAPLFEENARHILLLHAHDETEAQIPKYYEKILTVLTDRGVEFVKP